jgi:enoyl-CoA hydratase/carnithine racemase
MDISSDGYVAVVGGAADAAFADVAAALAALTDGYATRCVVIRLAGRGEADPPAADDFRWMERYPIPLVAAIEGDVSGAAAGLALGCDIRVAATGAMIGAGRIGTRRTLRLLGEAGSVAAMERGGRLDAGSALAVGLVSAIAADAFAEAKRIATVVASRGPIATRFAKEAIWRGLDLPLPEALRMETDLTILLQSTKDRAEGVRAFLDKRAPSFTGD